MKQPLPQFATKDEAFKWLYAKELEYMDNTRFCFTDDPAGVSEYEEIKRGGCCGYFDAEIIVAGRPAQIGCNYGH
jgi:hypothetical protein